VRILVVDDERSVRDAIERLLRLEGHEARLAADGDQALAALAQGTPDAVVLDVLMPGTDGLEVCRTLRAGGNRVPVLMLTARDGVGDRVAGLEAGADDYLTKPFALEELMARLRALVRRSAWADPAAGTLAHADLTMDLRGYVVRRGERRVELTRTEWQLLELLLRHPGQVLTRGQITEHVWGYDPGPTSNPLEVYVGYLRRKLEAGGERRLVHTVRGVGYVLRDEP
jgi:two-component system response regulator MprA